MSEDNTTSSSGGSDKGGPKLEVYRVFVTYPLAKPCYVCRMLHYECDDVSKLGV